MEILRLLPVGKDYIWGGTRLWEEYGKKIDMTPLAEIWECSVYSDGSEEQRPMRSCKGELMFLLAGIGNAWLWGIQQFRKFAVESRCI